ncbi:glycosyltransferase family 2 protein [Paenibacillus elgii]|uniref:glycosyltransferase family 2 protein n=1 Tax=Paenibacillus elgii TaxID=189691 RepID=UPI00203E9FC0|nr:glycosyltransferase family 2 protein [Paenibacillus elgii]MCM3271969.1 glycosyltransferase family 2 protein [Paenibacillus elgii]
MITYSVIIPVYNEEAVLYETYRRLKQVMSHTSESYELLFVNDGSRDRSGTIIKEISAWDETVKLINFSRNFGHQIAITAGMDYASGEAVIVIDADLQDPPELILEMIAKWQEGYDVVYAKRLERKGETFFKKQTARLFYRVLRAATDISIPLDTGDFRLIDRKVCDEMKRLPEKSRFVRGLVSWVGFRQTAVEYVRDERLAGVTKYSLKKMIKLSMDGLTSFSFKPLKLASYAGGLLSLSGLLYLAVVLYFKLFDGKAIAGWHLLAILQLFLTGFMLIMFGLLGEYIGRIYDEARDRPLYIVRECYGLEKKAKKLKGIG